MNKALFSSVFALVFAIGISGCGMGNKLTAGLPDSTFAKQADPNPSATPTVSPSATPTVSPSVSPTPTATPSVSPTPVKGAERVHLETSLGNIDLDLYPEQAPITVANFLKYAETHFYNQTIFHRVVPGFVIQGGGFTANMTEKPTRAAIKNEANNHLSNLRGTIAMARTSEINSATSQFFFNLVDNTKLDYKPGSDATFGYAVFGKITDESLAVMDKIAAVPTHNVGTDFQDVPVTPVVIFSITRK